MPASHYYQMNEIAELAFLKAPKSVLDIGVGFGKYGVLMREYLEVWGEERYARDQWKTRVDGIEAFKDYLSPLHDYIYDQIFVGNALDIVPKLEHKYDLILLIDVLEHFSREDGLILLKACAEKSNGIIISTPKKFLEQDEVFGNAYETHRSYWSESDLAALGLFPKTFFLRNKVSFICYAGQDADAVRLEISKRRNILEKTFSCLLLMYERLNATVHPQKTAVAKG